MKHPNSFNNLSHRLEWHFAIWSHQKSQTKKSNLSAVFVVFFWLWVAFFGFPGEKKQNLSTNPCGCQRTHLHRISLCKDSLPVFVLASKKGKTTNLLPFSGKVISTQPAAGKKFPLFKVKTIYMGVSKNNGTPKSSSFNRVFHEINHPFWGVKSPYSWKHLHALVSSIHLGKSLGMIQPANCCGSKNIPNKKNIAESSLRRYTNLGILTPTWGF